MSDGLAGFRERLDELDAEIVQLLGERFEVCREVALYKRDREVAMMQPGRVEVVRENYRASGAAARLPVDFVAAMFDLMIDATCRMEDEIIASVKGSGRGVDR